MFGDLFAQGTQFAQDGEYPQVEVAAAGETLPRLDGFRLVSVRPADAAKIFTRQDPASRGFELVLQLVAQRLQQIGNYRPFSRLDEAFDRHAGNKLDVAQSRELIRMD